MSIRGVIFQEVGIRPGIGYVVEGDDFEVTWMAFKHRFQSLASNTPKTVNAYASCHGKFSPFALNLVLSRGILFSCKYLPCVSQDNHNASG